MVFNNKEMDLREKLQMVRSYGRDVNVVMKKHNNLQRHSNRNIITLVGWLPHQQGWIKLNTRVSLKGERVAGG